MSQYRVALITPDYPPGIIGGAGVSSELLATELRKRNVLVDVFSYKTTQEKKEINQTDKGYDYYYIGTTNKVIQQLKIFVKFLFIKKTYDIYHVYNVTPLPALSLVKFFGRKMVIVSTLNNHNLSCINTPYALETSCDHCSFKRSYDCVRRKKTNRIVSFFKAVAFNVSKRISRNADLLIGLTNNMQYRYEIAGYKTSYKIIPNAYDPKHNIASKVYKDKDVLDILYVGQLNYRKGALDLLKAFALFETEYIERLRLHFIGYGPEQKELEELIQTSNLIKYVDIRKVNYDDLEKEYLNADIFVHPAKWLEPFSRTWLEAMGYALPIISSNNPGAVEILGDGALFYQVGNILDLNEKMKIMVNNSTLRKEMGQKNKDKSMQFSKDSVIDEIIKAHRSVMKGDQN